MHHPVGACWASSPVRLRLPEFPTLAFRYLGVQTQAIQSMQRHLLTFCDMPVRLGRGHIAMLQYVTKLAPSVVYTG
jgi:hypothetical protein